MQIIQEVKKEILNRSITTKEKSDEFGEVFTPFSLISDMLDLVKKEDWSNPETTFYDPCAGKGNFPILIIERLFEGLKEVIPDEQKRINHILRNQLFMTEYQEDSYEETKRILSRFGVILNFRLGNALETFPQEFGVERFTYTIANPPYQSPDTRKRIFHKFVQYTGTFSDNQIYVIPSSWVYNNNLKSKFELSNLSDVVFYPPKVFGFELRFSITVVKFSFEKTSTIRVEKDSEEYFIERGSFILDCNKDQYQLLKAANTLPSLEIRRGTTAPPRGLNKKITEERLPDSFSTQYSEDLPYKTALYTSVGKNPSYYVYTGVKEDSYDSITVNLPLIVSKYSLGNIIILPEGEQSLDNQYYVKVSSEVEAQEVLEYLQSDAIKYIVSLTKINDIMTTYKNALDFIPELQYRDQIESLYKSLEKSH